MFIISLHLLYKKKQGQELPTSIPKELIISIDPESFLNMPDDPQ